MEDENNKKDEFQPSVETANDVNEQPKKFSWIKDVLYPIIGTVIILGLVVTFWVYQDNKIPNTGPKYYIVSDPACSEDNCPVGQLQEIFKQILPEYQPEVVDVFSHQGKVLISEFDITRVPFVAFDKNIENSSLYLNDSTFRESLANYEDHYALLDSDLGATHFINEEAENRYYELNRRILAVSPETMNEKPQFDFFIMSFCPYCVALESQLEPVYTNLKDKVTFYPRYVFFEGIPENTTEYCEANGRYCGLHGSSEVREGARELCIFYKIGQDAWWNFRHEFIRTCSPDDSDTCWIKAAQAIGLDTDVIQKCYDEEGELIMRDESRVSNGGLKVMGTPTMFINGKPYTGSREANDLQKAICDEFSEDQRPEACNAQFIVN